MWMAACLLLAGLLTGCGGTSPTATAAPTSRFPTLSGVVTRPPLPATWTPTPSPAPSFTPTITPSITPPATLSTDDICERLVAEIGINDGATYSYFDPFMVIVDFDVPDASVDVRFTARESGEVRGFEVPPGGSGSFLLSFDRLLPGDGDYMWNLSVNSAQYGRICQREGAFTIRALSPLRGEFGRLATWVAPGFTPFTATPTPSATTAVTPAPEAF